MRRSMPSSAMASMGVPSTSRRFEALPVVPRSRARRNTPLYRLKTPSRALSQRYSPHCPNGWVLPRPSGSQGYRQATIASLSDSRRATCPDLARAHVPHPLAPALSTGRTAHPAPQRQPDSLALAGDRSSHQDSACAVSNVPEHNTRHIWSGGVRTITDVASTRIAAREARAASRKRRQTSSATLPHRTPAMAAGRTSRRWTAREVLSYPLPKVSA